ncbi:transcriptional regulator [Candidatus Bathyarchaeota archaeon]|nr:MAG: transcriptional regulator [Candidatus Bathyarchaeota archaeon]
MEFRAPGRDVKEFLAKMIVGDVIMARRPPEAMRKWRELFHISQVELARKMGVSPSVISDYESGRRKRPGTRFIRRWVKALLAIDEARGGRLIMELSRLERLRSDAILDMRELPRPISVREFCQALGAEIVACEGEADKPIYGYTLIDSIKAIYTLSGWEFLQIFGHTSERALIFTGVKHGRSPMVAVRISMLKPRAVVMHGAKPDRLAIELAELERIPLAHVKGASLKELMEALSGLYARLAGVESSS